MKRKATYTLVILSLFLLAFTLPDIEYLFLPKHFPSPVYDFSKETITKEKILLGRVLFYDPILSKDNTISCASCHSPYNSFAHTDHKLSHGINDQIGIRNAPALINLAWQKKFMADGAINHLDMQALAPITDKKEMGESLDSVIFKLKNKALYKELFIKAFGTDEITGELLLKSMAQFQLSLVSANSKYDRVVLKEDKFSKQEQNGYKLFKTNCNSCHTEPLFSTYDFASNGLSVDTILNDLGRIKITNKKEDSLLFKIPSLRNLSYTFPYMHDGRFNSLNEVLNHYTEQVVKYNGNEKNLQSNIKLSSNEKVDLIAFLLTLNDKDFVFNSNNTFPRKILLTN
jgi:cytochrome c peroxidase